MIVANKIMLGATEVPRIYLGSSLVYRSWQSDYAKRFVEFNLDNGYTSGYTADSIDDFCFDIRDEI